MSVNFTGQAKRATSLPSGSSQKTYPLHAVGRVG